MTYEQELTEAKKSGFLSRMLRRGHISYKPIYYLDIYIDKKTKHLTNTELAERLGVTRQTIHRAIKSISD